MVASSGYGFQTRQAVADLLNVVQLHRSALARIGASNSETEAIRAVFELGGHLPEEKPRFYSSILLAAAMPDEDFNAFVVATALLLADRLQSTSGGDDLYWNYEAFSEHYLLADSPVRAALMNAFRLAHAVGKSLLPGSPNPAFCFTRNQVDVLEVLRSENNQALSELVQSDPSPEDAGLAWENLNGSPALAEQIAFRYLYEREGSLHPRFPQTCPLIAWT